ITAGPEDFARIMAQSAAVATNFFHGCVFALLNAKPFVCASSPYRFNKVRDLAHAVGAEKHLVAEDAGDSHYRSEEHTSELQSLMRNSYAVFFLNKKKK